MQIRKMDELRAASLIGNKITAELKEGSIFNKPKEFQLACSLLMRWINSNEKKAFELFPAYASKEDRMQLMTPEAAAELSDELDRYNELIKEHGCNTDSYKQQGYNIIVNAGGETYYYEVKTRTQTSMYRHSLNFSRSQAALFRSKNYRVLLIIINKQYELSSSVEFSDLFDCFESGSFTRSDGYSVIV